MPPAAKKQITRHCHWVPQGYLRHFAAGVAKKRIWRLSKSQGEPELKLIGKVAVRNYLYVVRDENGVRNDAMERRFAELERFFGERAWAYASTGLPDLTWTPLRKMLALTMATMWLRTPWQLEIWKDMHQQLMSAFAAMDRLPDCVEIGGRLVDLDHSDWDRFRTATDEDMKRDWNWALGSAADVAQTFVEMRWAMLISEHPVFITSDNPVMVGDTLGPHRGLKHADAMVTFPLSPTHLLCLDNRHGEPDGGLYPMRYNPASMNNLLWRNADQYMFSHRPPDEICAEILADAEAQGFM